MTVSVNYPTPVWVNGFQCRNCSDVDLAKKHIDPAHPMSGPFNVDAKSDPTRELQSTVTLGGLFAGMNGGASATAPASASSGLGGNLDLSV